MEGVIPGVAGNSKAVHPGVPSHAPHHALGHALFIIALSCVDMLNVRITPPPQGASLPHCKYRLLSPSPTYISTGEWY